MTFIQNKDMHARAVRYLICELKSLGDERNFKKFLILPKDKIIMKKYRYESRCEVRMTGMCN